MGIKGIYGEVGPGQRIALAKLAVDTFEETGRPLRIAIDISIWQFQIQSGRGGTNPALRTFYYRLLRLLSLCIQPLFVFDGKNKPPFKRNKRTGACGTLTDFYTKKLLELFGFPFHVAPGEAEAECALLQREGLVDAVLSEDVDTLMFGCTKMLRNWSSEESRGNHAPTHVSVYDAKEAREGKSGLDRQGMILVALMSGGDYMTEGIPRCGIKVACEAARAGFGKSLCMLSRTDNIGLKKWRDELAHELMTNESKHFRTKHKSLQVPNNFPNKEVLGYYTHPNVSASIQLTKLKEQIRWNEHIDIAGLRQFVGEAFQWTSKTGAKKFIRGLAPALLILRLRLRATRQDLDAEDLEEAAANEMKLAKAICGRRRHFSTDATPEVRIVYNPRQLVGLDLNAEPDEQEYHGRDRLALVIEDEDIQTYASDDDEDANEDTRSTSPKKKTSRIYDPNDFDKVWVPESIAKVGIPLLMEDYEESQRNPQKFIKTKFATKKAASKGAMPNGALEPYLIISKPGLMSVTLPMHVQKAVSTDPILPINYLTKSLERSQVNQLAVDSGSSRLHHSHKKKMASKLGNRSDLAKKDQGSDSTTEIKITGGKNPWTIAQSHSPTNSKVFRVLPHSSKPGLSHHESMRAAERQNTEKGAPEIMQNGASSPPTSPSRSKTSFSSGRLANERFKHSRATGRIGSHSISPTDAELPEISALFSRPLNQESIALVGNRTGESACREHVYINITSSPSAKSQCNLPNYNNGRTIPLALPKGAQTIVGEKEKMKRFVILRESLEGSWKEVEDDSMPEKERRGSRAWRKSAVDVVDMTGG